MTLSLLTRILSVENGLGKMSNRRGKTVFGTGQKRDIFNSVAEPEPHHFSGSRAGAVSGCGSDSGSVGSKRDVKHG
jgi:hypothetical protein